MQIDNNVQVQHTNTRVPDASEWDRRVDTWEETAASPAFQRLAERTLSLAAPSQSDVVVDLGAGTGLLTIPAARAAARVIAVDYSEMMIRRLRARASEIGLTNVECIQADLRELPLPDDSVDIAVSSYAFHHLADEAKELALAETRRILRPGGRLVVCDMMFGLSLERRDRRILAGKIAAIARKGPAGIVRLARNGLRIATRRWEHPAPPQRWRELLEARRFVDVHIEMQEHEAGIASARRPAEDGA